MTHPIHSADAERGTFECHICGKDRPHSHAASETIPFHQYRPTFEASIFSRLSSSNGRRYLDMVPVSGGKMAFPAEQARATGDWAERSKDHDGYCQYWLNTMWVIFKEGITARAAAQVGANGAADIPTWQVQMDDYEERFGKSSGRPAIHYAKEEIAALRARLAAGAPAETPKPEPKDWPEDFAHENGNYQNKCSTCGALFIGHKRRITCKECATPAATIGAPDTAQRCPRGCIGPDEGGSGCMAVTGDCAHPEDATIGAGEGKDAVRLDFLIQQEAWLAWSKDGESCRVFHRDEDGDTGPIMGWIPEAWAHDPREAIDKARAAMRSKTSPGEAG